MSQELSIDSLLNEIVFNDDDWLMMIGSSQKFQFLYTRMNYDHQTYFAGRDMDINQYNITGQISYFHSIGISLGAAAVHYSAIDPNISTILLMAGYNGKFSKSGDYRYRVSYDRFIFPKSQDLISSSFNSSVGAGVTVDKKFIGSRFDYSLLMGKSSSSQLLWDIYGDIKIFDLGKYDNIRFEPEISMYMGTDETVITQVGLVPGRFPREYTITEIEKEKFGWMNTELKLPITVNYKSFDFEFGFNINFPKAVVTTEKFKTTTYFNFAIGYAVLL